MAKFFEPGVYGAEVTHSRTEENKGRAVLRVEFAVLWSDEGYDIPATKYPPNFLLWLHSDGAMAMTINKLRMMGCDAPSIADACQEDALVGLTFKVQCEHSHESDYDNWDVPLPEKEKRSDGVDPKKIHNISRMKQDKWAASKTLLDKRVVKRPDAEANSEPLPF